MEALGTGGKERGKQLCQRGIPKKLVRYHPKLGRIQISISKKDFRMKDPWRDPGKRGKGGDK